MQKTTHLHQSVLQAPSILIHLSPSQPQRILPRLHIPPKPLPAGQLLIRLPLLPHLLLPLLPLLRRRVPHPLLHIINHTHHGLARRDADGACDAAERGFEPFVQDLAGWVADGGDEAFGGFGLLGWDGMGMGGEGEGVPFFSVPRGPSGATLGSMPATDSAILGARR